MSDNPFRQAREYLKPGTASRIGAILCSIASSICLASLFPLLFLFVDLMVYQGHVGTYSALHSEQQQAFRDDWNAGSEESKAAREHVGKIRPSSAADDDSTYNWECRWQASTYALLERRVGSEAAEHYLPLAPDAPRRGEPNREGLGLLAPVVRESHRPTGTLLGWIARWNSIAWKTGDSGSANGILLTELCVLAFIIVFLRGLFMNASAYLAAKTTSHAALRMRRALYTHAYRLTSVSIRPDAQDEAAELVTRRVEQVQDGLQAYLTGAFRGPLLVGLLLAVVFSSHLWLSLSFLLLAALIWLVAGQAAAWYRRDARIAGRRADARLATMRETMSVMRMVKAYLMERYAQTRLERHLNDLSRSVWRKNRGETFSRPTLWAVIALAAISTFYLAGWVVLAGDLTLAGLVVKAAAVGTLVFAVNRWIATRSRIARARGASADVFEFLDRRGETLGQGMDAEFLHPMTKRLDFVDVSMREPGTGRMVLENVGFTIPSGSRAAVVFADPAEALAIAHLITRFVDPTAGEIRIDGKNTRWVTSESIRTQVALVLDQSLTFSDTVANNIGCGEPGYTTPQIIEAAKLAHAHQFVQRLPYGYETLIGSGGILLKPGERFRVALARAILRDPSLIIIEEPEEPLDADSLVLIDDCIARIRTGRTLLFLARRPSTVKAADKVFVLQGGRLVATGHHDELLGASELYRLMHFKQTLTATA